MKQKVQILSLAVLLAFGMSGSARAETLSITGNGSDSESSVTVENANQTQVNQTQDAAITNDVTISSNTGNNSASDNTNGDVAIETGDVNTSTEITNSANISSAQTGCCDSGGTTSDISGNGSGTDNAISVSQSSPTVVSVTNNATIRNYISGTAVTGNNTANYNTLGDTTITTGNIWINEKIMNGPINVAGIDVGTGMNGIIAKISGNGSDSDNSITYFDNNGTHITVNNYADIFNRSIWDAITGNNSANDNTGGKVGISTGDISYVSEIVNGPINVSQVSVGCCKEKEEKPTGGVTPGPTTTTTTTTENKPSENGRGGAGAVLAAAGKILPATGGNWLLLAIFANMLMLFMGMYLRLRSGNSPGLAVA
jgi:hypothetical protein